MVNRWGMAALAMFAMPLWATPLTAQDSEPSPQIEEPQERPPRVIVIPSAPPSSIPNEEDWPTESIAPSIDVTDLKTSLEELLPQTAPPPPSITEILPANTPAAMIVNTREDAWTVLKQYALFAQLGDAFGLEPGPQALPLLPLGIDYAEDVQPWVGDGVAIALLPVPSIRTINPIERSVTIVPIDNATAFIDFIPALAEARAALPEQHSYRTFPIWHWPSEFVSFESALEFPEEIELEEVPEAPELSPEESIPSSPVNLRSYRQPEPPLIPIPDGQSPVDGFTVPGYAVAHLGNYIVTAEDIGTLRQWIEYQTQGGPKLNSNPNFEKTQNHPQAQSSLATVYGNMGQLLSFNFGDPFQDFGLPPIPQPSLSDRAAIANLFSNVTFDVLIYPETQGLHLEAHLYSDEALPSLPLSPNADNSILSLIPAATYLMGSGYDISGFWNDVSSAFSFSEVTAGLLETARSLVSLITGLDLDTEIFGWMDGEYSLFLFPSQSGLLNAFFPNLGLEAGVLLETSNREAAETALQALDNVVGENITLSTEIANYPVTSWQLDINTDGQMDSVLSHTWLTDDTLAFTSGNGAMERLVVPAGFHALSGHSTFQNATATFPKPNNGYFYVNASSTLSFFYNLLGFNNATEPWAASIRSYFGTIRSLSVTTSSSAQQFQIDTLLGLALNEQSPESLSASEDNPLDTDQPEEDSSKRRVSK